MSGTGNLTRLIHTLLYVMTIHTYMVYLQSGTIHQKYEFVTRVCLFGRGHDAAAELERNTVSKHQVQPEYGDEQADAGRDCRTRLAGPYYQARTRIGKYLFSLFS